MKKLLVLLLVVLSLSAQAQICGNVKFNQPQKKEFLSPAAKIIITYSTSILMEAAGDALYDKGITQGGNYKQWGKVLKMGSKATLLLSPFWNDYDKSKWLTYALSYTFLRVSLFDPMYNVTRGLPVTYIGTTSFWDKELQKLKPPDGLMAARGVSLIMGISLPINNLNTPKRKSYRKNTTFSREYRNY
jgi:hypothetical protein